MEDDHKHNYTDVLLVKLDYRLHLCKLKISLRIDTVKIVLLAVQRIYISV